MNFRSRYLEICTFRRCCCRWPRTNASWGTEMKSTQVMSDAYVIKRAHFSVWWPFIPLSGASIQLLHSLSATSFRLGLMFIHLEDVRGAQVESEEKTRHWKTCPSTNRLLVLKRGFNVERIEKVPPYWHVIKRTKSGSDCMVTISEFTYLSSDSGSLPGN